MHTPSVDTLNRRSRRMFLAIRGEARPFVFKDRGLWTVVSRDGARHFLHRRWAYKHAATRCPAFAGTLPGGKLVPYRHYPQPAARQSYHLPLGACVVPR